MKDEMDDLNSDSDARSKASANAESLALLHILSCSIGWIGILWFVFGKIPDYVLRNKLAVVFNDGLKMFYFPGKPGVMAVYVGVVIGLFLYYMAAWFFLAKMSRIDDLFPNSLFCSRKRICLYVLSVLGVNLLIAILPWLLFHVINKGGAGLMVSSFFAVGICLLIWLPVICFPLGRNIGRLNDRLNIDFVRYKYVIYVLITVASIQIIAIFAPFVFGRLRMINEYLDIPEQTILGQTIVDNDKYFNSHNLIGLVKYNPKTGSACDTEVLSAAAADSQLLRLFVQSCDRNDDTALKYYYDSRTGELQLTGEMSLQERQELQAILGEGYSSVVNGLFWRSREKSQSLKEKAYSAEESAFLSKNSYETVRQIYSRWVIHHAGFILVPALEYSLGKPSDKIFAQYGLPNTIVAAKLMKMLGGISYHNYYRAWYALYLVYYALFLWVLWVLFRKQIEYMAIAWVLATACTGFITYQFLILGPGLNPIRHFFDVFVVLFLYLYLANKKTYLLVLASLSAVLGVVNNSQLGIICMAAFVLTMGIVALRQSSYRRFMTLSVLLVAIILAAFAFYGSMHTYDPIGKYYRAGLLGFGVPAIGVFAIFIFFSLGYLVLLSQWRNWDHESYITMFLLFLSQGYMAYFVWGGTLPHFLNMAPLYALAATKLVQVMFARDGRIRDVRRFAVSSLMVLSLVLFVLSLSVFYYSKGKYNRVFTSHKTYDWNFDTARFESTMDPEYFRQAVDMINKYAPVANNIHMISKYDSFLSVLSGKYSALPFFDLQWFLMTKNETALAIASLRDSGAEYIFVDTDIERNRNAEVIPACVPVYGVLYEESRCRIRRLEELKSVFDAVKDQYEPVEKGWLITVYRKKPVAVNSQVSIKE